MKSFSKIAFLGLGLVFVAVVCLFRHTSSVKAQSDPPNRGCSVASLKGTYAFHRTGVNNVIGGPIAQIGINVEDGEGRIKLIRTTRSENGVILDWFDQVEPGTYTVDSDCTGTFFNQSQNLVVVDGGKRYFLLATGSGTIVTEEGTRIEEEKD